MDMLGVAGSIADSLSDFSSFSVSPSEDRLVQGCGVLPSTTNEEALESSVRSDL